MELSTSKSNHEMSKPAIKHSGLSSTFTGLYPNASEREVWQFRGIKYGVIPARFNQATLNEKFPEEYDATAYGYIVNVVTPRVLPGS